MPNEPGKKYNIYRKYDPKEINMYNTQNYQNSEKENKNAKLEAFKQRLDAFKNVNTLAEAKELLNKSMPVCLERTVFYIGEAKCTIINNSKFLKIFLKTKNEIIGYHFI